MSDQPPPFKITDLNNLPRGAISIKGLPVGRNTRLPSIRSPRDLTLGAQPKRVFTPKIPVRREKKVEDVKQEQPSTSSDNSSTHKKDRSNNPKWKPRHKNIIQTEGSLFGEGLAPCVSKKDSRRDYSPKVSFRKNIKREPQESDISFLLRHDFIDDKPIYDYEEDDDDERDDLKPIMYPCIDNSLKIKKEIVENKVLGDENFAKDCGYDVDKIAKYIKKEKDTVAEPIAVVNPASLTKNPHLNNILTSETPNLLLMLLPEVLTAPRLDDQPSSTENSSSEQSKVKGKNKMSLSALPEGMIGKFQVLKSGNVRLIIGDQYFNLDFSNPVKTKYEAVSIETAPDSKEMVVLGNIKHKLISYPDVDKLLITS